MVKRKLLVESGWGSRAWRAGRLVTLLALAGGLLAEVTACSFCSTKTQSLSVVTDQAGARVMVNGKYVGETPVVTTIPRGDEATIMVDKPGYDTVIRQTNRHLSPSGVLDIVGAIFIFPPLGLLSEGAYKQEPNNIVIALPPRM